MELEVLEPQRFDVSAVAPAVDISMGSGSAVAIIVTSGVAQEGPPGADGTLWFSGHGSPGTVVGSHPGDYYLDLDTGAISRLGD